MGLFKKIRKHVLRLCRSIFIARVSTPREPDQDGTDRLNSPSRQAITITEGAHVDETPSKDIAIDTATVKLQPKATDLVNRRPLIAPTTLSGAGRTALDLVEVVSEAFSPLKSVASGVKFIVTRIDKYEDNENLLQRLGDRVTCLNDLLKGLENSVNESHARAQLESALKDLDKDLEPIRKTSTTERIIATHDIARRLDAYLGRVHDALSEYQTRLITATCYTVSNIEHHVVQQGLILQDLQAKNMDPERTEKWTSLQGIATASHAVFDQSDDRAACWPGTRMGMQQTFQQWCDDPNSKQIFWLRGHAGSGKSTISQSFAHWLRSKNKPFATFFFSRNQAGSTSSRMLFPTLAYQLATTSHPLSAKYQEELLRVLQPRGELLGLPVETQLRDLIIHPVVYSRMTAVILIDALDECHHGSDDTTLKLLSALAQAIDEIPSLKFFITSRPEAHIRSSMRLPALACATTTIHLGASSAPGSQSEEASISADSDIRLYLDEKLTREFAMRSDVDLIQAQGWPTCTKEQDIDRLVEKAAGLFIFASTTIKFITSSSIRNPASQLALVLSHDTKHEGTAGLDALYIQILQDAFSHDDDLDWLLPILSRILRLLTIALGSVSLVSCAKILGIGCSDIKATLRSLHSVLYVPTAEDDAIIIYHKSFSDFLTNVDRCTDKRFFLDSSDSEYQNIKKDYDIHRKALKRLALEDEGAKPPSVPGRGVGHGVPQTLEMTVPLLAPLDSLEEEEVLDESDAEDKFDESDEEEEEDELVRQIIREIREKGLQSRVRGLGPREPVSQRRGQALRDQPTINLLSQLVRKAFKSDKHSRPFPSESSL